VKLKNDIRYAAQVHHSLKISRYSIGLYRVVQKTGTFFCTP